jgi:hypothetical protein
LIRFAFLGRRPTKLPVKLANCLSWVSSRIEFEINLVTEILSAAAVKDRLALGVIEATEQAGTFQARRNDRARSGVHLLGGNARRPRRDMTATWIFKSLALPVNYRDCQIINRTFSRPMRASSPQCAAISDSRYNSRHAIPRQSADYIQGSGAPARP